MGLPSEEQSPFEMVEYFFKIGFRGSDETGPLSDSDSEAGPPDLDGIFGEMAENRRWVVGWVLLLLSCLTLPLLPQGHIRMRSWFAVPAADLDHVAFG
jgi:hypothetical protein